MIAPRKTIYDKSGSAVEAELGEGEQLLWSGRPRRGLRLRASDGVMIPFSILWFGFAIFWESGVLKANAPLMFKLWGIPFLVVGFYISIGRFFADARARAKTVYGVTNLRIVIVDGILARRVRSLNLRALPEVSLSERSDGSGTISFGSPHLGREYGPAGWPGTKHYVAPAFEMIERAREVYEIIRRAQSAEKNF